MNSIAKGLLACLLIATPALGMAEALGSPGPKTGTTAPYEPSSPCDCTTYPFSPNPPCLNFCTKFLSSKDVSYIKDRTDLPETLKASLETLSENKAFYSIQNRTFETLQDVEKEARYSTLWTEFEQGEINIKDKIKLQAPIKQY